MLKHEVQNILTFNTRNYLHHKIIKHYTSLQNNLKGNNNFRSIVKITIFII